MSDEILGLLSPGVCTLGHPLPAVAKYWVSDHASCALWGGASLHGRTPQSHYIESFRTQYSFTAGDHWWGPIQSAHGTLIWTQYAVTVCNDPSASTNRLALLSGM